MNFGQMYSWHVLLLPAAVVALVIAHVLLVRKHGVVPPLSRPQGAHDPAGLRRRPRRPRSRIVTLARAAASVAGSEDERGARVEGQLRPYDLVKEFSIAVAVIWRSRSC